MDYKEFVESMAKGAEDRVFFNSGPTHAAIVMSRIFKYSKNTVKMYCGGFSGTVSNDESYLKYLKAFLEKGGQLQVMAEEDLSSNKSSEIFKVLRKYPSNVSVLKVQQRMINVATNTPVHFAIGDDRMLRIETDTSDFTATVNFGDTNRVKNLTRLFDEVWADSQNVKIALPS